MRGTWQEELGRRLAIAESGPKDPSCESYVMSPFNLLKTLRIVYPTAKTVKQSLVGPGGFGTLFCQQKDYVALPPNLKCFYECVSDEDGRCRYAMHSKIMTALGTTINTPSTNESDAELTCEIVSYRQPLYYYVGSHNFTQSAWGKLVKGGTKLQVANYEVGVLLPASEYAVEIPYQRLPRKYAPTDLPWDQNAQRRWEDE